MNRLLREAIPLMLTVLSLPLAAQDGGDRMQMMLRMLDSNNDGAISLEEYTGTSMPMMARIDADSDGFVSEQEYLSNLRAMGNMAGGQGRGQQLTDAQRARVTEQIEQRAHERFLAMDSDGDKKVSLLEYRQNSFKMLDRNQDGKITAEELSMQGQGAMRGRGNQ